MIHECVVPMEVKLVYSGSVDIISSPGTYSGLFWDGQHAPLTTVERPLEVVLVYEHHEVTISDCGEVQGIVWTTALTDPHQDKLPKGVKIKEKLSLENHGQLAFRPPPGSCYYVDGVLVCC